MFDPSLKPYLVMKRKLLTALIIIAGVSFTACQDETMDELIQDTELNEANTAADNGSGSGGNGSQNGSGDNPPPGGG